MSNFDFCQRVSELGKEARLAFYVALVRELTVANRIAIDSPQDSPKEILRKVAAINEIIHRVANGITSTQNDDTTMTYDVLWHCIVNEVENVKEIGGLVGTAITTSYEQSTMGPPFSSMPST